MKTPDRSGWSQRTQRGIVGSTRAGFETRKATQRGSIDSPGAKASRSGTAPGARRRPWISAGQLALDDQLAEVLVAEPLRAGPARVGRRVEGVQDVLIEEVGERSMADVMEQAGDPEGLDDQALGRDRLAQRLERRAQAGVQAAGPQAGFVHHPQAVREAAVLGGREDPASALELADPAQALEPGRIEQVVLGVASAGRPRAAASARLEALGQLDIPVDRVADQVRGRERMAAHQVRSVHREGG